MVWIARTFKHLVQTPCNEQGHHQQHQVTQSPVKPGLECFQGWFIYQVSGQSGPTSQHPHHKKCHPYI